MEEKQSGKRSHRLVLSDRAICSITGVREVISFDVKEVVLDTEEGILTIKGEDLHVKRLTLEKGELDMEGMTESFVYSHTKNAKESSSLFSRIFR
jgi:sporulation protein YabP